MATARIKNRRRQEQGLKWTRIAIAVLSTIGLIDTGSITLTRWGWIGALSCPGGIEGCDKVLNSPWGTIADINGYTIPLSLAGFVSYLVILILSIIIFLPWLKEKKIDLSRKSWWVLFALSCGMSVFSILLIGIMLFKIKAYCFFCILSGLISIIIFSLVLIGGGWNEPGELIFRAIIIGLIVILGGFIWSSSVDPNRPLTAEERVGLPPEVLSESSSSSISLAKHLTSIGAVQYSAYWCPHCHDQKELFGKEAVSELRLVECAPNGKNSKTKLCEDKGINSFPSWEINGGIDPGVKSLEELADLSNYLGDRDF